MSSPVTSEIQAPARAVEAAPSQTAVREPTVARFLGLIGCLLIACGFMIILMNEALGPRFVGKPAGAVGIAVGLILMMLHALRDDDQVIRRAYGVFGFAMLVLMLVLLLPNTANLLKYGWACALGGLCFLLTLGRHETDAGWLTVVRITLGGLGAAMALVGFLAGVLVQDFLITYGTELVLLGLIFLCAFVSQASAASDAGYKAGLAMAATAIFVVLFALLRSIAPHVLKSLDLTPYFVPNGMVLLLLGSLYGLVALGLISDNRLVVLTRRELASYFYSPMAYLVMLGMALIAMIAYLIFIANLLRGTRFEPIVASYFQMLPPFVVIFLVPAITMRLLSEEKRSGTYEVLMCAPVKETSVVLSKFLAGLMFFMLLWAIWALYLIGLRVGGGKEFDYRPLLSFYLALAFSGAGFISMGLFFSSLTKSQMAAAVLTFVTMLGLLLVIVLQQLESMGPLWRAVLNHLSYYALWEDALNGRLMVREMLLQGSFTFFWLFLTVKVLEARRWS
jgi:ABC-2 type transport system permease protein